MKIVRLSILASSLALASNASAFNLSHVYTVFGPAPGQVSSADLVGDATAHVCVPQFVTGFFVDPNTNWQVITEPSVDNNWHLNINENATSDHVRIGTACFPMPANAVLSPKIIISAPANHIYSANVAGGNSFCWLAGFSGPAIGGPGDGAPFIDEPIVGVDTEWEAFVGNAFIPQSASATFYCLTWPSPPIHTLQVGFDAFNGQTQSCQDSLPRGQTDFCRASTAGGSQICAITGIYGSGWDPSRQRGGALEIDQSDFTTNNLQVFKSTSNGGIDIPDGTMACFLP